MTAGDLNLPFEEVPPGFGLPLADAQVSGGVVVLAAVLHETDAGPMPCLMYRFAKPDGSGFYPPIALVVIDAEMHALIELTAQAVHRAISVAEQARSV